MSPLIASTTAIGDGWLATVWYKGRPYHSAECFTEATAALRRAIQAAEECREAQRSGAWEKASR